MADRLFGNVESVLARWIMSLLVLCMAVVSAFAWMRWGDGVFVIGTLFMGFLGLAGVVRLVRQRN
ncbi:hypothetical protein [Mycobacterium paraterrae]|uniref:UsfY protein n=1 Tax=Mycobacterium paraterrae TaxID=577492 RepID=A0ABY3VQP0_9MYCO|nr:hypothetical protein [Mycobacterium paraterrae]UMB71764.1 hypothetical protein MKK62_11370 [Mycobacterium paraterrae]